MAFNLAPYVRTETDNNYLIAAAEAIDVEKFIALELLAKGDKSP